jgi:hypothetical protein
LNRPPQGLVDERETAAVPQSVECHPRGFISWEKHDKLLCVGGRKFRRFPIELEVSSRRVTPQLRSSSRESAPVPAPSELRPGRRGQIGDNLNGALRGCTKR